MSHDRIASEREFFDAAYAGHGEQSLNGFYELSAAVRFFRASILRDCQGVVALEYGCGTGGVAFELAARGAIVTGVDISDVAVELARKRAAGAAGLSFRVGNAEALSFDDRSFDLVCGTSILHHLDTSRAVAEIRRVLRPGGRAIFYEPVGYNPAANIYRRLTPQLHTEDEHPLLRRDFTMIRAAFPETRFQFFDLASVAAIPFLRFRPGVALLRVLEGLDRALLTVIPPLRLLGNVVVIEMRI